MTQEVEGDQDVHIVTPPHIISLYLQESEISDKERQ